MTDKIDMDIFSDMTQLPEIKVTGPEELLAQIDKKKPFVVRGFVRDWPLVKAGLKSAKAARDYLIDKHEDRPFAVSMGSEDFEGRIFYREDMSMNVQMGKARLPLIFERIDKVENNDKVPIIYISSVSVKNYFKGLHEENHIDLPGKALMERIWIGTKSRIAAHTDFSQNIACVAVGRRRFTLFPPEEYRNLYIGPLDNTPAGRAISMVDFHKPDIEKFPKFKHALEQGQTATLEPGDAIHIPTMWWHHVEGLSPFNVLINYWWLDVPRHLGVPQNALNHAIMSIRDLPEDQKRIWRDKFNYYVFEADNNVTDHIPKQGHGILGPMTPETASKIRTFLMKMLNEE